MIIKVKKGEWQDFYVPPIAGEITGLEAVRVTGRLRATRSGANYNWLHKGFVIPSAAQAEPFLRIEFRGGAGVGFLGWHEHASLEDIPEGIPALSWGGSLVDSPAVVWGREVFDLSFRKERELFIKAAEEAASKIVERRQGGLTARPVSLTTFEELAEKSSISEEMLDFIVRRPVRPVVLFNHAVFVNRMVGLNNYRLVEIDEAGSVVTSPDHPLEPLRLGEGVWLLSHPLPSRGVD